MVINTNTAATNAAYNLGKNYADHERNLTRLSTGLRINSSYDDAAGLAVSMKMAAQVRRADAYSANIANSRSFLETQDGALKQLGKMLERMSELKALAHDVTKNSGDVDLYEKEYIQLQTQFALTTTEKFNGISLFSPTSTPDPLFLNNPERGDQVQISRPFFGDSENGSFWNVGHSNYSVISGSFSWREAKADAEAKGGHLATITSQDEWDKILSIGNLNSSNLWLGGTDENTEGSWEWVTGETWSFTNWHPGQPDGALVENEDYLHKFASSTFWNDWPSDNGNPGLQNETVGYLLECQVGLKDIPWSDLHASIQQVADARAQNGAEQMRLQMEAELNATNTTNLESALSRIQDVDIAKNTSDLAKTRVLIDAGTAMSAQANSSQQSILKLLDSTRN
ncbi:MAG: flagellin [Verrucomicrobia bacterium]|nr:flagellin [Verrucomicrobiota bacterium]